MDFPLRADNHQLSQSFLHLQALLAPGATFAVQFSRRKFGFTPMNPINLVRKTSTAGGKSTGDPAWTRFYHFITGHFFSQTNTALKSQEGRNAQRDERDQRGRFGGPPGDPNAQSRSNHFQGQYEGESNDFAQSSTGKGRDEKGRFTSPDEQDDDWADRFVRRSGSRGNSEYSWGDNTRSRTLYDQGQSHRGKEPKSYQRANEHIDENIDDDHQIDASE